MRLGCYRPIQITSTRCHIFNVRRYPVQQLNRPVSSFTTALQDPVKDKDEPIATRSIKRSERRKAYEYSSPEATFARHVLRTILRECSYLPDPFTADYIRKHALSRFRTNEYKAWKNRDQFASQDTSRRKEARSAISTLQRANEGQRRCMLRVLNTAYGRTGKRRHELIKPLLYVEGQDEILSANSNDDGDASAAVRLNESDAANARLTPTTPLDLTPQLRALLSSQIRTKPPSTVRTTLRSIEPSMPELNSWLRPMPQNRIRNARKKHYAMLLDRVQAPLPAEEWERLRDLAMGKLPAIRPARRRKIARSSVYDADAVDDLSREKNALELMTRYGRVPRKALLDDALPIIERGRDGERWMQRLYAEVFCQCPRMDWNGATSDWEVTWGFPALVLPERPTNEQVPDVVTLKFSAMEAPG